MPDLTWRLVGVLWAYFDLRKSFGVWEEMLAEGLASARRCHDQLGTALMLLDLGTARRDQGAFTAAVALFDQAHAAFEHVGDLWGVSSSLTRLGDAYRDMRSYDKSVRFSERALAAWRVTGDRGGEAWTLSNLGLVYRDLRRDRDALDAFRRCRELFEELGDVRGVGSALRNEGGGAARARGSRLVPPQPRTSAGRPARCRRSLERSLHVGRAGREGARPGRGSTGSVGFRLGDFRRSARPSGTTSSGVAGGRGVTAL
ncbi:tetratricopeptide repeat protein [Lentzea sp. NPDC006480]|uniref:tetratricopeptide repeat protein n=1 Tax=Lentzea sp. NPDC006480 TaxID=3157176 RepID=UPI0033B28970